MPMPWKVASVVDERARFVELALRRGSSVSQLALSFGISRKTAYKWLARHKAHGRAGFLDSSRRPHSSPNATSAQVVRALVALRMKHPHWGARKLLELLRRGRRYPSLPSPSTATSILKKHGLVRSTKRRSYPVVPAVRRPVTDAKRPNDLWCVDFKGEFKLGNGEYCWPLTVTDAATRFLIGCFALSGIDAEPTIAAFERMFEQYGLPKAILSDNGTPFASESIWGLTVVSRRWLRYGIRIERTRLASPQDNGRHERFHRTLKQSTALPPALNLAAQQRVFDRFRREYNHVRPHEALRMQSPAQKYRPSKRKKPELEPLSYPGHFHVCTPTTVGNTVIRGKQFHVGRWAYGELLGLEEVSDERFRLHFGPHPLAELDLKSRKVIPYGWKGRQRHRTPTLIERQQLQKAA